MEIIVLNYQNTFTYLLIEFINLPLFTNKQDVMRRMLL